IEYAPRTANAQSGRVWMLRNDIGGKNNFTRIKLEAPAGCNRSGIGCRVYVYAGGVRQMRDIQSGVGRWGMATPLELNFGLGDATAIDSVVVRWAMRGLPVTTIANPPLNRLLRIRRDGMTTGVPQEGVQSDDISIAPQPARSDITV
ncbi:MAG: ASPIC/UnbV domain-containing protein, partial [Candidatus Kapaibacterium sp.]